MEDTDLQSLQTQLASIKNNLDSLSSNFYKNNFSSHQDFNKSSNFTTKITIPVFTVLPNAEPGDICAYSTGGTYKLMICTAVNTWTIVGTQS